MLEVSYAIFCKLGLHFFVSFKFQQTRLYAAKSEEPQKMEHEVSKYFKKKVVVDAIKNT